MDGRLKVKPGPRWVDIDVGCHAVRLTPDDALQIGTEIIEAAIRVRTGGPGTVHHPAPKAPPRGWS